MAPALLFVALLGGALFFGVLAMSGKNETGIATDNAAVTDPSPSKAAPAARTIATTRPSVTGTPPTNGRTGAPAADRRAGVTSVSVQSVQGKSVEAQQFASPLHKPEPGRSVVPSEGDECAPAGAKARSETGDLLVCQTTDGSDENHWGDDN